MCLKHDAWRIEECADETAVRLRTRLVVVAPAQGETEVMGGPGESVPTGLASVRTGLKAQFRKLARAADARIGGPCSPDIPVSKMPDDAPICDCC